MRNKENHFFNLSNKKIPYLLFLQFRRTFLYYDRTVILKQAERQN